MKKFKYNSETINPDVFLFAAESLFEDNFIYSNKIIERTGCCYMIEDVIMKDDRIDSIFAYLDLFRDIFKPKNFGEFSFWWADPKEFKIDDEARILALLLAYQITKRGDF